MNTKHDELIIHVLAKINKYQQDIKGMDENEIIEYFETVQIENYFGKIDHYIAKHGKNEWWNAFQAMYLGSYKETVNRLNTWGTDDEKKDN